LELKIDMGKIFYKNPINEMESLNGIDLKMLTEEDLCEYGKRVSKIKSKINQQQRLMRLWVLSETFHQYKIVDLDSKLLKCDNTWESADRTAGIMNLIVPHKQYKVEDFLHNKDELCDSIIDRHESFRRHLGSCEDLGMSKEAVYSFCKNVIHHNRFWGLNSYYGIHCRHFLFYLVQYFDGKLPRDELVDVLSFRSLSGESMGRKNLTVFRNACIEMENLYTEIETKQKIRANNRRYGKQLKIPF